MPESTTITDRTQYTSGNQIGLALALMLFLVLPVPITFFPEHFRLIFAIIYSLLVFTGLRSVSEKRRHWLIGLVLAVISFLLVWISFFSVETTPLLWANKISLLLFFIYLAFYLFKKIIQYNRVDLNVIYASISGYLIVGIMGGLIFQLLEMGIPNSFTSLKDHNELYDLHYFSFVTLTTLGFGDITPITEAAKAMTIFLSITGQLYLTILIAMLVGKYLSQPKT